MRTQQKLHNLINNSTARFYYSMMGMSRIRMATVDNGFISTAASEGLRAIFLLNKYHTGDGNITGQMELKRQLFITRGRDSEGQSWQQHGNVLLPKDLMERMRLTIAFYYVMITVQQRGRLQGWLDRNRTMWSTISRLGYEQNRNGKWRFKSKFFFTQQVPHGWR